MRPWRVVGCAGTNRRTGTLHTTGLGNHNTGAANIENVRIAKRYKEKLGAVIDRLVGARTTLPDGSVGFNAMEYEFCLSVLESAIGFQQVIPEPDRRGLIREGGRRSWAVEGRRQRGGQRVAGELQRARARELRIG